MTAPSSAAGTQIAAAGEADAAVQDGAKGHSARRLFKNTIAIAAGSNLAALGRLVALGLIVRGFGAVTLGEYAVVVMLLSLAEGIADFGTTEVFVRDISRPGADARRLLRVLTAAKLVQVPLAFAALVGLLVVLRYPAHIVHAAMLAGASLAFYGVILVYRVLFRWRLTMEREVAAELASVLVMIALIRYAASPAGGLLAVLACHLASRGVFGATCAALGMSEYKPSLGAIRLREVRGAIAGSASIGAIGLLVALYQALDLLLLSKLSMPEDVGYYSAAQRLSLPILMGLAAIGSTLYSVLAAHWPHNRAAFERSCQRGLEAVFVLGGVAVATVLAGAEFFTGLLGAELVPAGTALRVLTILALAKAFSMTLGPTLLVVKAQAQVLKLILVATAAKAVVLAVVASKFGFMGVAWGALAVEVCAVVVPSIFIIKRLTGVSVKWRTPLYALGVSAASVLLAVMLFPAGSVYAAAAAGVFYVLLVLANGTVNPSEIRMLLRRAPVGEPAVTTAGGDSPGDD